MSYILYKCNISIHLCVLCNVFCNIIYIIMYDTYTAGTRNKHTNRETFGKPITHAFA